VHSVSRTGRHLRMTSVVCRQGRLLIDKKSAFRKTLKKRAPCPWHSLRGLTAALAALRTSPGRAAAVRSCGSQRTAACQWPHWQLACEGLRIRVSCQCSVAFSSSAACPSGWKESNPGPPGSVFRVTCAANAQSCKRPRGYASHSFPNPPFLTRFAGDRGSTRSPIPRGDRGRPGPTRPLAGGPNARGHGAHASARLVCN
jgi:hypothetical protein